MIEKHNTLNKEKNPKELFFWSGDQKYRWRGVFVF